MDRNSKPEEFFSNYELAKKEFSNALSKSITNRYLFANIVYLIYTSSMMFIDYGNLSSEIANKLYVYFGILHVVNALMYIWTWEERSWLDNVLVPDYLNVCGASLYLYTSILYGKEYIRGKDLYSQDFYIIRYCELLASIIEMGASIGWCLVWYREYSKTYGALPTPTPGRGWTLEDPDMLANFTVLLGALLYLIYNCEVCRHYDSVQTNMLYVRGDEIYFLNSIFYLLAALRDCQWFWFMPSWGRLPCVREGRDRAPELWGEEREEEHRRDKGVEENLLADEERGRETERRERERESSINDGGTINPILPTSSSSLSSSLSPSPSLQYYHCSEAQSESLSSSALIDPT
mmetsp:Transcript_34267/g.34929  ORF Transcript_34267/g.34929 Transcript_34267/m.34929 type:complete len:349 (+) Transcript_34267:181-1227(+)